MHSLLLSLVLLAGGEAPPQPAPLCNVRDQVQLKRGKAVVTLGRRECFPAGSENMKTAPIGSDLVVLERSKAVPLTCAGEQAKASQGNLNALLPMTHDGRTDVVADYLVGEGGYHLPVLVTLHEGDGKPECTAASEFAAVIEKETLVAAKKSLAKNERLNERGGRLSVEGAELVITRSVAGPNDPNCCPSRANLVVRFRMEGDGLRLKKVERGRVGK